MTFAIGHLGSMVRYTGSYSSCQR